MDFIRSLIRVARAQNASDIHIIAGLPPAMRIHGSIVMMECEPLTRDQVKQISLSTLTDAQKKHLEEELELCFSLLDDSAGRVRVTVYYHNGVPELSIRLCAHEILNAGDLGLPPIVADLAGKSNGLVLITGPTGVGKTTTLNYMVDLINHDRRAKIVMIEDPVEYMHRPVKSLIVQQELYTDTKSFSRALIHVLRQNPDVIVIGEMRDLETISTALTAAETGHLVLATLHTPNVIQTMERIIGVFPSDQQQQIILQLANSLQGVIAQDLIPTADGANRVLAYEVLLPTPAVKNSLRENTVHKLENILMTSRREGMISMDASLAELYQRAVITYDAAVSRARDPMPIKRLARTG